MPLDLWRYFGSDQRALDFCLGAFVPIAQWLNDLDLEAGAVTPITFLQVFVGFSLEHQAPLPVQVVRGSRKSWIQVSAHYGGEIMGRTLCSQMGVFRYTFDLVMSMIKFSPDWHLLAKPEIGVFRPLPALTCPWPALMSRRVNSAISAYCSRRPIGFVRDLARPWP